MINLGKRNFVMIITLRQQFLNHFGTRGPEVMEFFSPGRVNLIGEHIDYNGGLVLPFAINKGTSLAIRKNGLNVWRFYSESKDGEVDIKAEYPILNQGNSWVNYPLGVIALFERNYNVQLEGMDFYFVSNLPQSSGLSSSAAIEAATAIALDTIFNLNINRSELAILCQQSEHEFAGVQCGIMDQFVCLNAEANHAMLLNCSTLKYEHVPLHITDYEWVIINSNKHRSLTESAYNQRLKECKLVLDEINRHSQDDLKFEQLCHISPLFFTELELMINSETLVRRARHTITENQRVLDMVEALELGNVKQVGRLLNESHLSLKMDYEVTGFELDTLVAKAQSLPYVAGSRMTGAGFGGCTVSLVRKDSLLEFEAVIREDYVAKTSLFPSFYVVKPSVGAHALNTIEAYVGN